MKLGSLCAAAALLAGCAAPPARIVAPPRPVLDQALAAPCTVPAPPEDLASFDAVDDWLMHELLPALADCARRHAAVVQAWPR